MMDKCNNRLVILSAELKDLYEKINDESFHPSNSNHTDQVSLMSLLYVEKVRLETELKTLEWILNQK